MDILDVRIDTVSKLQALEKVRAFFRGNEQHMIFTPNPEMIVEAQKDTYFKEILNKSSLNICDGKGIQLVSKEKVERIPGIDFMLLVCELAEQEGKSIYLLGSGSERVVLKAKENIGQRFPQLKIVGAHKGPSLTAQGIPSEIENDAVMEDIILHAPDILFVAFGHGKQEKWIYEFLPQLPSVHVAMGVGGAFDYISKKVKRAPRFVQKLGFEWLWRLFRQPSRFFRIWNATIKFLVLFVKNSKQA